MEEEDGHWLRDIHQRILESALDQERKTGRRIKFSPGDKVRVINVRDNRFVKHGWRGIVLDHSYAPWVAFEKLTHLGDPANPFGIEGWHPGHMDCLCEDQLELISGRD